MIDKVNDQDIHYHVEGIINILLSHGYERGKIEIDFDRVQSITSRVFTFARQEDVRVRLEKVFLKVVDNRVEIIRF